MQPLKQMNLIVKKSPIHGFGVFADQNIEKGNIIEECYTIMANGDDLKLDDYYFHVQKSFGILTGYGLIYNHSPNPNTQMYFDAVKKVSIITAITDIHKGEEIFVNYGEKWFKERSMKCKKTPLWYKVMHKPLGSIVRASLFTVGLSLFIQFLYVLTAR